MLLSVGCWVLGAGSWVQVDWVLGAGSWVHRVCNTGQLSDDPLRGGARGGLIRVAG